MLLVTVGKGQVVSPFTMLFSNIDADNQKIYVEIMYEKSSCQDYQVKFRLDSKKGSVFVKVDSFLNNQDTYTSLGDSVLQRPTAGGYKLRFQLPNGVTPLDSPFICLESQSIPYRCEGCGAAGSSPLFSQNDIHFSCPYAKDDLIACSQSRFTGQWEAWIQDPRDCKPYKAVLMPNNRWWFAQNLNYQKDLQYHTLQSSTELGNASTRVGEYFCPNGYNVSKDNVGSQTIAINNTGGGSSHNYSKDNSSISPVSCRTYGALYTWTTAMSLNGRTLTFPAVPISGTSDVQGICPEGWKLPSSFDWGQLINLTKLGSTTVERTRVLKSTNSCLPHSSNVDSICSTYDNPAWAWRRSDYNGKISYPYALGTNKYGLALVPNGFIFGNATTTNRYYHHMGTHSYTWLSSENGSSGYASYLDYSSVVGETTLPKIYAAGVRCISESDFIGIDGPNSIRFGLNEVTFSLYHRPLNDWTYTWSAKSNDIA
ncbi:MAG: fibrobacter succinogenes major paralogous domain-containing protein, partial [Prevotellaceae bacterium]|nr:fibrobacter succinogenes major paralogous domain-containing protein [Prevotellaceae bacterium]